MVDLGVFGAGPGASFDVGSGGGVLRVDFPRVAEKKVTLYVNVVVNDY